MKLHKNAVWTRLTNPAVRENLLTPAPEGKVTFVFTDVQSSTKLWEAVPDAMREALKVHDNIMRELMAQYQAYEVKVIGDAFMVAFRWVVPLFQVQPLGVRL